MSRLAFTAIAVALAVPARAGIVLEFQDADQKQTTVELEGKKLRSSPENRQDGHWAIFDGENHVLYAFDEKDKSYRRIDEATASEMGKRLKDVAERAKAKMTPEQRAQLEAFLAAQEGSKKPKEHTWNFERTGGSEKVAGFSCDDYRVLRDGSPNGEACFIRWGSGAFRKEDFQAVQEMGRFLEKTFAEMSEAEGRGKPRAWRTEWITHFVDTGPGFPAVMDRVEKDGKRTRGMQLVKIERKSIEAGRFAPPADYREKPFSMTGGPD